MRAQKLPYLQVYRKGKRWYAYYRRGGKHLRLNDPAGEPIDARNGPGVAAAWHVVHAAWEKADDQGQSAGVARTPLARSIGDLITKYRASPDFQQKRASTQKDYEKSLRRLERDWGEYSAVTLQARHVTRVRDTYAWREEPDPVNPGQMIKVTNAHTANKTVSVLSILMSFAINPLGWRETNPAFNPKRLEPGKSEGYRAWRPAEFKAFWDHADAEWRLAALLALLTGQRGQDQVKMRWSDYDGQQIQVVQQKQREWVAMWVPCPLLLKEILDARRAALGNQDVAGLTILTAVGPRSSGKGKPWVLNTFQHEAGKAIAAAGLEGVVWHGLRSTAASWAAEEGATDQEIAALLGHTQVQTTRRYSRGASQRVLARSASAALVAPLENITRPTEAAVVPNGEGSPTRR